MQNVFPNIQKNKMKITILSDNHAGKFCRAEHGLCYLVETSNRYLFDTGSTDLFLWNAQQMGIDLETVETVIISHGHDDHSGGLKYLENKTIVAHTSVFVNRYRNRNNTQLGIPISKEEGEKNHKFKFQLSQKAFKLDEQTWFLGEIPRVTPFENKETSFHFENGEPDFILDDTGIAIETPKGLVVLSGCAHAGICNTIIHARNVTGIENVHVVMGGFHLTEQNEQLLQTMEWLKYNNIAKVMPSHCTALPALSELYQAFGFIQIKTGNTIVL